MKRVLWTTLSFLLITIFITFLRFMLEPLWPNFSKLLLSIAKKMKLLLNIKIDVYSLSVIIFIIFFGVLYSLIILITSALRKKPEFVSDELNPYKRYKSIKYGVFKTILCIFFLPLIYTYGKALYKILLELDLHNPNVIFFGFGFILFSVTWILFWKSFQFFSIFEHEFTHLITALLFFHKPKSFFVDKDRGGWVQIAGTNFIVTLSPYFLLTFCFLILPLFLIVEATYMKYLFFVLGIFTSYHTLSTFKEINFRKQPDLIFNGRIFSFIVITLGNILSYGFILAFLNGGFSRGREFFVEGWHEFINLFSTIQF